MNRNSFSPTILLVDGAYYIYRAYHAYPKLTHFTGEPNGVLFGVLSMLSKLRRQHPNVQMALLFDGKKGSQRRKALYPAYKAQRLRAPEPLLQQIEPLYAVLRALGLPIWEATDGVEADDLLGSLAKHQMEVGKRVGIVTDDKDLVQLVEPNCALWSPSKERWVTVDNVMDIYGVAPDQIVDFLSLVGDAADNIPGVPGIGRQRALQLLKGGRHLVELLHLSEKGAEDEATYPPEKLMKTLLQHAEVALLSYRLAELDLQVSLPVELLHVLDDQTGQMDYTSLYDLLSRWGLKGLWKQLVADIPLSAMERSKLEASGSVEAPMLSKVHLCWISVPDDWTVLERACIAAGGVPATEVIVYPWYEGSEHGLVCLGLMDQVLVIHVTADPSLKSSWILCLQDIGCYIKKHASTVITYQIKKFFKKIGHLAGWDKLALLDVELMSYVLDSTSPSDPLERLYTYYTKQELSARYRQLEIASTLALTEAKLLALQSVHALQEIYYILKKKLSSPEYRREKILLDTIEQPVLWILARMEIHGILFDPKPLFHLCQALETEQRRLSEKIAAYTSGPINLESPAQLRVLLFEELGLPVKRRTPKGIPSTDETALQSLKDQHPIVEDLLTYRSLSKLRSTYVDRLPDFVGSDGRIHTTYHQAVTVTGRLSSRQPNLQNLPITGHGAVIRSAFVAKPGAQLLSADYSQIELRLLAHLSKDERLCSALCQQQDIHTQTAAEIFDQPLTAVTSDQRRAAKTINFGLIYGMSAHGLANNLQISRAKAQEYIKIYFSRYPGVLAYLTETKQLAAEQGFVETLWGRKLWLPAIKSRNRLEREAAEREAVNAPIQGSCADLIKLAMIRLAEGLLKEDGIRLLLQIHDELLLEVEQPLISTAKKLVHQAMSEVIELRVPLVVSIGTGTHWGSAHV